MADYLVRSPRQATTIFGLDGSSAPRKKSLFYVRFKRSGLASGWQNNLGFMVKSLDRPAVQPQIEELNQYNKKRWITTGYKSQPMRVVLYDTADSLAMRMWSEYSSWYFGDFGQSDASNWKYDVTMPNFGQQDNGSGFGFQPRPLSGTSTALSLDLNSQYFFELIEVYQVFGGQYTQFDLVNPKINAFDPDELDYSVTEPATISITFAYEAILYRNDGQPMPISTNADVSEAFGNQFDGNTFDVPGALARNTPSTSPPTATPMPTSDFRNMALSGAVNLSPNSGNTMGGGSLSQFGSYNFGSLSQGVSLGGGTAADVSYLSTGNNTLSTLLNMPVGAPAVQPVESIALSTPSNSAPSALNAATVDAAQGALNGAGGDSAYGSDYINNNLVGGVAASSVLSGGSPTDQVAPGAGLSLNTQSYGVVNAQRPAYSQIGVNQTTQQNSQASSLSAMQAQLVTLNSNIEDSQTSIAITNTKVNFLENEVQVLNTTQGAANYLAISGNTQDTLTAQLNSDSSDILSYIDEINQTQSELSDQQAQQFTLTQQIAAAQATQTG